jgi:hypothetical protein
VQGGIQELLSGFGVEVVDELQRVFEICKEHGHLLALAFQGSARGADLLGERGRNIGEWSTLLYSARWALPNGGR